MQVNCKNCGTLFSKAPCHVKRTKNNFCSLECHNIRQTDRVSKRCKVCDKEFFVRNCEIKKFSTCSRYCMLASRSRERNGNWRGGITKTRKAILTTALYRFWRTAVFVRDNYTCMRCGKRGGGELHAHHVKSWALYKEYRYDVSNGMTLCKLCHIMEHSKKKGIAE